MIGKIYGFFAGLTIGIASATASPAVEVVPKDVSLCEVVTDPDTYDLATIRLRVRLEKDEIGRTVMRDGNCPYTHLILGAPLRPANGKRLATLKQVLARTFYFDRKSRGFAAMATLTGVFDSQGARPEPALLPTDATNIQIIPAVFWTVSLKGRSERLFCHSSVLSFCG